MRDIDEMFKDILGVDDVLEKVISAILESNKPIIINIYLGDE